MARTEGKRQESRNKPAVPPPPPVPPPLPPVARTGSNRGRTILYVGLGAVALAVVATLSIILANEEGTPTENVAAENVTVRGDSLVPYPSSGDDRAVGETAPEVESVDFSGAPASILHDGTPKMLVFLAHWCPHCQREVPALQSWINDNGIPEGVELVSVATSINEVRDNYPPDRWLEREGWTPRVVVDNVGSSIAEGYGLTVFPYYVMLDGDGTVLGRIGGGIGAEETGRLLNQIATLG